MRTKIEKRILFSNEQKEKCLEKSEGRCCRCGKRLKITDKDFTVEHAIPISKGGTNSEKNLVALCENCNIQKSNLIIHPYNYYPYLKEKYAQEVMVEYERYCIAVDWFEPNNFTREDAINLSYEMPNVVLGIRKAKGGGKYVTVLNQLAVFKKAEYSELDMIKEYVEKYSKKIGLPTDSLEECISDVFNKGCIYYISHGNEIVAVLPIVMDKMTSYKGDRVTIPALSGLPILYQKPYYKQLIIDALNYIFFGMAQLNKYHLISYSLDIPENDAFLQSIAKELHASKMMTDNNNRWGKYVGIGCFGFSEEECQEAAEILNDESIDPYKLISDYLEKALFKKNQKTKKSKENNQKKANKKLRKEQKRDRRIEEEDVFYDYDEDNVG